MQVQNDCFHKCIILLRVNLCQYYVEKILKIIFGFYSVFLYKLYNLPNDGLYNSYFITLGLIHFGIATLYLIKL